jgi:WD40 repeat protein
LQGFIVFGMMLENPRDVPTCSRVNVIIRTCTTTKTQPQSSIGLSSFAYCKTRCITREYTMKHFKLGTLLCLTLVSITPLLSQSLSLFEVDASNFPTMKAKFYAFDAAGQQQRLSSSEITLKENGIARTITSVSCPPQQPPKTVSIAMSIDISGSMGYGDFGEIPVELGKKTATELCNAVTMPPSEFALQTCHATAFILQDFTKDRSTILGLIPPIRAGGDNDFVEHLLNKLTGLLSLAKNGKNKRVAVLYTDAWWYALKPIELKSCLDTCNKYNIEFYAVIYSRKESEPNGIKASLQELCSTTGGNLYDGITSTSAALDIAHNIQQVSQGSTPCDITWTSEPSCQQENASVVLTWQSQTATASYVPPVGAIASISITPNFVAFGRRLPSTQIDTTLTLTANNSDFTVTGINRTFGSADFSVVNTNFPLFIPRNTSKTITLRTAPSDSGLKYASFEIVTDNCLAYFSAYRGFPGKKATASTLKLTRPNGGETFAVGSDTVITWDRIAPSDTVTLEYSHDNGLTWKRLTNQATGLKYLWNNMPRPTSAQCLVRVKQGARNADANAPMDTNAVLTLTGHTSDVCGIAFSPDGSRIATASLDKTSKVWDATTGALILTLTGHTDIVWGIAYSPDGSFIATASSDTTAKVWDAITGALILTLTGHTSVIYGIAFSPDGSRIATGSFDQTSKVWDANTGALIRTLTGYTGTVHGIAYSPDGSRIATAVRATDRVCEVWDANTGTEILTLPNYTDGCLGIAYSPDGSRIATAGMDGTGMVWDANTGQAIMRLSRHIETVRGIAYSPDGSRIATASMDNTAKVWDANSGALIRTLIGHTNALLGIAFSPDGSRIATTSADNTAKVWEVLGVPIQEDVSDSVFSIVAPVPASQDVDMKQVVVGGARDSLVSTFVQNGGTFPFRVDSIQVIGTDASQFLLVSGIPPFEVPTSGSRAVEFRFGPTSAGVKTAQLLVFTQADTLRQTIQGEGVQPTLLVVNNLIDFGAVDVGKARDSMQVVTIKNIGNSALIITNTRHAGPNDKDYTTISGGGAFTLAPNQEHSMDLRFAPSGVGRTSGRLLFDYNGVGSPATVQLFGAGLGGKIAVNNDSVYVGEKRVMKLLLMNNVKPTTQSGTKIPFRAVLSSSSVIYEVDNVTNFKYDQGGIRYDIEREWDGLGQTLAEFTVRAGLANADSTEIVLEDFAWLNPDGTELSRDVELQNGSLKLLGICYEGGARLINPNGTVALSVLRPNPVARGTTEVELETTEKGRTLLDLHDVNGRVVKTFINAELSPERRIVRLDCSDVPDGAYFLRLQTATDIRTVRIEVLR